MSTTTDAAPVTSFRQIVAANVRALAGRRGVIPAELAPRIGMSRSSLSARWTGKIQWQLEDLEAVARVLGTTPWALTRPAEGDLWDPAEAEQVWQAPRGRGGGSRARGAVRQKGLEPPTF